MPWRKAIVVGAVAVSLTGFGGIIVRAADDSGVYEVAKSYTNARGAPRFQLPQIFQPSRPRTPQVMSYAPAPVFAPGVQSQPTIYPGMPSSSTNRKPLAKTIKVGPTHLSDAEFKDSYLSARTSYCVRTCDGFYFPIGNPDTGSADAHEAACNRACPGADTAVYVANAGTHGIDDAVTRRGSSYRSLPAAFAYRTQYDSACTCNGAPGQARNYSVMTDFTLRQGDLVMSREGLKEFKGQEQFPYRSGAFAAVGNASLSATERRWVQASEASSLRGMQGAKVSSNLRAQIDAQVRASLSPKDIGLRGIERTINVSDGRKMRYVGPDVETR